MNPHPVFLAQDRDPQMRAACYRARLREGVGELTSIRAHLEQERALGDAKFLAMIEKALGGPAHVRHRGRPRRANRPLDGA